MLMLFWVYVMAAAFMPGGAHFAKSHAAAIDAHMRSQLETIEQSSLRKPGLAIGAASGFAR